jgi:hypothetical protein
MALQLASTHPTININEEYLAEWISYREEDLGSPMTPRAIKMLTKKLLRYSIPEQERIICTSIERNWKGVHYTPPERQASSRQNTIQDDLTDRSWA